MKHLSIAFLFAVSLASSACKKKGATDAVAKLGDGGVAAPSDASGGAAVPAGSAEGSSAMGFGGGSDLPAACGEYKAMIEKVASCAKLPKLERDQMKQAYDNTSATWPNIPADGQLALGTACKAAAAATKQAAGKICGWR